MEMGIGISENYLTGVEGSGIVIGFPHTCG